MTTLQEEQTKRLGRIRSLLAQAEHESTSAPEAEAFTAKAAALMAEHGITQAMMDDAAKISDPGQASGKPGPRRIISHKGQDHIGHKMDLLHAVAEANGCTTVVTEATGPDPKSYLFGYDSDMDLAEMLFTSLLLQASQALAAEDIPFGDTPRSFNSAWWAAYGGRVGWRLYTQRGDAEARARKAKPKAELVLKDRRAEVASLVKADFPETRRVSRGSGGKSRAGRAAGYNAGNRAKLNAPAGISGGSASRALEAGR
jgi:Protein of unknown function (DUF2786)